VSKRIGLSRVKWAAVGLVSALTFTLTACDGGYKAGADGISIAPDDSNSYCQLAVQSSSEVIPSQTVAVFAPTDNFVDFTSLITRSETQVKATLGADLTGAALKGAKGRELSIVLADGNPGLVAKRTVKPLGDSEYDIKNAIDSTFGVFSLANKCAAGEFKRANDQVPTTPGSDLLKGLAVASDQLTIETGPKEIFVLANGIQTVGALQMQLPGGFPKSSNAAHLLAMGLLAAGEIPDLKGAQVNWYGLGEVDGVRQKLSEKQATSLVSFWREVIQLGNGTLDSVCSQCGSGKPHPQAIKVKTVSLPSCFVRLYEADGVEFKPDTATFVDPQKASETAKSISGQFTKQGCTSISVTGYAAAGVDKSDYELKKSDIDSTNSALTKARAKAFADLIHNVGYQGDISSMGAGTCGTEWSASGKADPDLQRLCRRVEVSDG